MDGSMMNETRKIVNRINADRKELPPYDEFRQAQKQGKQAQINDKTKGQVETWCKNIRQLNEDMQKQINSLGALSMGHEVGGNGGGVVTSNYMAITIKRLQKDIEDLFKICQLTMVLDIKKTVTDQKESDDQWTIMKKNIKDELNQVDVELNQTPHEDKLKNGYIHISKLLNMRDIIHKQIMFSCLYRKLLVWDDLYIHPGEYCPDKVVECSKILNDYSDKLGYKPTKIEFKKVRLEQQGYFTPDVDEKCSESTDTFKSMVNSFLDMESLIKKNFLMVKNAPNKIHEFNENNPVQQTLREQLEILNQEMTKLRSDVKKFQQERFQNKEQEQNKEMDQQKKVDQLKNELVKATMRVDELNKKNEKLLQDIRDKKKMQKETEEQVNKLKQQYLPKLKETIKFQKEMQQNLQKISNDAELLPWMFRAEAKQSKQYRSEKDSAVNKMKDYEKDHFKLINERDDLANEIKRKERMAMLVTAARNQMMGQLEGEKKKNLDHEKTIKQMQNSMKDSALEVERFKQKHDEMFASTSSLNARIEELEQHKLHLLEKLKTYGDRGDLSYIVKTQKLTEIKATQEGKDGQASTAQLG